MDNGTLPRKFCSDLKDCHLLASAYGDLSSERVYIRLEKLTCTERLTGEILETQVAGYVSGEDGKAGVRGVVVDRAGPVIRNSLVGGFFSGMSKFFESSQSQPTLLTMPLGAMNPLSAQRILSAGAASGTAQALEKYADFFVKRAEQLQPVLQVAAGRQVDIVFTQGTRFGDTSVRKALSKIRGKSRQKAVQTLEADSRSSTDTTNWLPSIPPGDTE
jgi:conjugal transfer pilus assembly protein TraB